jgi:Mechanosensitive ion channel/Conserved TM helix
MSLSTFLLADVAETTHDPNIWDKSTGALYDSFTQAYQQVILLTPRIVAMVAVLVIGYVVARMVARVITLLSEKLGLQVAAERSGLAESMAHTNIGRNVPMIVGTIIFWLLMCVFIMAAFNILGLQSVTDAMGTVVNYIPRLLAATVVVVVGLLAASFLRGLVATSADRVGLPYAEHLANASYYVLTILTLIAVCDQLGLRFDLLQNLILIASGGIAIGFGLAFGLGGRDVMAGILAGYYLRQRLHTGDHVMIGQMEGTVREVGAVATTIETDEDGLLNRRSVPNTKMLNEAVR